MITTYIRSSSYGTYGFCQHKYLIDYVLGFRSPANKKAEKGTIVHKALELLAKYKLAKQNGNSFFLDDELGRFDLATLTSDIAIQVAFSSVSEKSKDLYDWSEADYTECRKWMYKALKFNNGMFHPCKQHVIQPEQYFDIEIKEPWAWYSYRLPDGNKIEGYLRIKGTIDLISKIDSDTYEITDYKTGKRMDWNTGEEKTYEKLQKDAQLHLYHYAIRKLYPDIKNMIVTIFYINDGGPFSMPFSVKDMKFAEKLLQVKFNAIRNTMKPKLIYPDWKCSKLCHFYKTDPNGEKTDDYKKSACQVIKQDLIKLGMDKVITKYAKDKTFSAYGSGGGRTKKEE